MSNGLCIICGTNHWQCQDHPFTERGADSLPHKSETAPQEVGFASDQRDVAQPVAAIASGKMGAFMYLRQVENEPEGMYLVLDFTNKTHRWLTPEQYLEFSQPQLELLESLNQPPLPSWRKS